MASDTPPSSALTYAKPATRPAGVSFGSGMQLKNVSYAVGGKHILDNVSLEVKSGETLCLLGPSGCGKTTLLHLVSGLLRQSQGVISLDDRVLADQNRFTPPENRGIGLVFQDFALFPHLTIRQNVAFGLTALNKREAARQADVMLERVGLLERSHQYPDVLSGGEQQRVALARALAPRPGIILMDEPFSGLDSRLRDAVRQQCLDLLRETRSTAIIVTHDAEEALRVGDRIALLNQGRLVQSGSGRDLYQNPVNMFAAAFFSEINAIPVEVEKDSVKSVFGVISRSFEGQVDTVAALRNHDLQISPYREKGQGVSGKILARRFVGTSELLLIQVEGLDRPVQAKVSNDLTGVGNDLVRVSVSPEDIMLFPRNGD